MWENPKKEREIMSYEQVIERAAKNVGVDVGALSSRADAVLRNTVRNGLRQVVQKKIAR